MVRFETGNTHAKNMTQVVLACSVASGLDVLKQDGVMRLNIS